MTNNFEEPIADAKIIVENDSKGLLAILTTDSSGESFLDVEGSELMFLVSHPAYNSERIEFSKRGQQEIIEIKLSYKKEILDQVVLTAKKSITKSGDTTIIQIPYFKNSNDRRFSEVLKRIPGLEVTKQNEIKFKGRTITDILINGQKLFDADYNSAVDIMNPKDMVQIKIIENYNDNEGFTSQKKTNDIALDVDYNSDVVFSGSAGLNKGISQEYSLSTSNLAVTKGITNFIIAETQNLGKSSLTNRAFTLKTKKSTSLENQYRMPEVNALTVPLSEDVGAFNESYILDDNIRIKIDKENEILIKVKNYWEYLSRNDLQTTSFFGDGNEETRITRQQQGLYSKLNEIDIQYSITNKKDFLSTDIYASDFDYSLNNDITINENQGIFKSDRDKSILSMEAIYQRQWSEANVTTIEASGTLSNGEIGSLSDGDGTLGFDQKTGFSSNFLNFKISQPIVKDTSFKLELIGSHDSGVYEATVSDERQTESVARSEVSSFIRYDLGPVKLSSSVGLNYFDSKLGSSQNSDALINGSLTVDYVKSNLFHKLTGYLNSSWINNQFKNPLAIRIDPTSQFLNNQINEPFTSSNISYSLTLQSILHSYSLQAGYSYNNKTLVNLFLFEPNLSTNQTIISNQGNSSLSATLTTNNYLRLFKINTIFNSFISLNKSLFAVSPNAIQEVDNLTYFNSLTIKKRISNKFFARVEMNATYNRVQLEQSTLDNFTFSSGAYFDINVKHLSATIEGVLENYGNDNFVFINMSADYSPSNSNWQFGIYGINLLDINSITDRSISPLTSTNFSTEIPGRRMTLAANYSF
ncbi:hypothetical protein AAU57_14705 [Nonlabens sp. YIK11]|uniref:hypothetical protein n=1 Tax=Nonlabens sp. YIK11 TaxID=1453349 RepID=UPI0006DC2E36|nr:hypothetical protein [Nonlabens sp. YIK11]KQC31860.1 hypothetical protein AAU57_14705 [Nonlabens sp. YIK11]